MQIIAVGQVNLADSTSNEWYITGVQLEAGTTASDFEFLPVDVNLERCHRYYRTLSFNQKIQFSMVGIQLIIMEDLLSFKNPMRATPTLIEWTTLKFVCSVMMQ